MFEHILYQRKRRDRWWRYLVLKEAFQSAEPLTERESNRHCLRWASQRTGLPLSEPLYEFWDALLAVGAERNPRLRETDLQEVEARALALPIRELPAASWLDLFRFSIGLGFFTLANTLREKFLDRAIFDAQEYGANRKTYTLACYACAERGDYDGAAQWLSRMSVLGCEEHRLSQARWFIALISGTDCPEADYLPARTPADGAFGNLVEGQRVALVGPVATQVEHGTEIDGHDLVVKLGYRGGYHSCDPVFQGRRIDISYYNNTQAVTLSRGEFSHIFASLRWAVCHNRKGTNCFLPAPANLRQVQSLQWLLPDTHLNAGPNAIIDMLRFRPASIHVYNTDMMLSSGRFAGYREPGNEETNYTRSFIKTHDPILQYRIMNRLWATGRINGDRRFEKVMGLGLDGYLTELQKAYGAVDRALF